MARAKQRPDPKVGSVRWVYFAPDGSEHDFVSEPKTGLKTLRVEVIEIRGNAVIEQTWTKNQKMPTPGGRDWCPIMPGEAKSAGWVMAETIDGAGSTRWVRRRASPTRKAGMP